MKRDLIRTTLKVRVRIIRPDWKHFFLAALPLVNNTCFLLLFVFFVLLSLYANYLFIIFSLRPCQHVSVFIWKRNFFFTDTASVHTYSMKTINEKGIFRKHSPEWNFLKRCFPVYVWKDENGTFRKRWRRTISSNLLRAMLKTYSKWRTGASLSCLLCFGLFLVFKQI